MQAGKLDRLISIQSLVSSSSPSGEPIETWVTTEARRPASMWPVSGDERYGSPEEVAKEQIEFRVRYSGNLADLSPLSRIVHPAMTEEESEDPEFVPAERRIHDILAVHEIGRRKSLRIVASRRVDVPA